MTCRSRKRDVSSFADGYTGSAERIITSVFSGPAGTVGDSAWRDSKAEDMALGAHGTQERLKARKSTRGRVYGEKRSGPRGRMAGNYVSG